MSVLDQAESKQTCRKVMETFQKNTQLVPNANALPATLFNTKTPLLDYLPKLLTFESHLLWTLAQALLDNSLKQWLTRLVEPGLPAALERIKRQTNDPWAQVFTHLCFGQLQKAAELANSMNAYQVKMLIDLTAIKSMQKEVRNQIVGLKDIDVWNTMTRYQQRVWHVLAGQLGWVDQDYVVVEDQTWQCTLCMYVFYDGFDSNPLSAYHHVLKTGGTGSFGENFAFERTAPPDQDVVWYQMLNWWYGGEQTHNIKEWPLDLTWLLTFYRPDRFQDDEYALAWINRLQSLELSEWAIYASLFMKLNRDDTVDQLLQSYEWENEDILLHTFYISKERVLCARAINAHQEWDYDAEYGYYLQASHINGAKDALFNFLLPKLYNVNDDTSLTSSLDYITQYTRHYENSEVKALECIYKMLATRQGDKQDALSKFHHLDVSKSQSFNFKMLVYKLKDAFNDI